MVVPSKSPITNYLLKSKRPIPIESIFVRLCPNESDNSPETFERLSQCHRLYRMHRMFRMSPTAAFYSDGAGAGAGFGFWARKHENNTHYAHNKN